ncbi:hypothetical protein [Christensenella timonensis]|uniref:hypothetical protein n=1 Tax=Christensenella timonensis TaxID=1816678 RepID=UPI00083032B2|nr:hypothetical protein [Christensenella timonensis]
MLEKLIARVNETNKELILGALEECETPEDINRVAEAYGIDISDAEMDYLLNRKQGETCSE